MRWTTPLIVIVILAALVWAGHEAVALRSAIRASTERPEDPTTQATDALPQPAHDAADSPGAAEVDRYSVLWLRSVRQPPVERKAPVRPPPPPRPVPLKLLGTVTEPGNSFAILVEGRGTQHLCRVGESVQGVKVTAIAGDGVTVQFDGREIVLKPEGGGT